MKGGTAPNSHPSLRGQDSAARVRAMEAGPVRGNGVAWRVGCVIPVNLEDVDALAGESPPRVGLEVFLVECDKIGERHAPEATTKVLSVKNVEGAVWKR